MIRVLVNGAKGNMGSASVQAIENDPDLTCVATADVASNLADVIQDSTPDVVLDFTHPDVVFSNVSMVLQSGIHAVVGTTGLTDVQLASLNDMANQHHVGALICPNFAIGAILMMQFATTAARYLKDVSIIEYHHPYKADAPSGTAIKTVDMMTDDVSDINEQANQLKQTERTEGCIGGLYKRVPIHSIRMNGYIASQEVLMGAPGQRLSIRHDSMDRASFMPGVCLALKKAPTIQGLVYGLEHVL
tara:strand:+ start:1570 stop:2307 length:738 start_codon:yes stop_codon:yes gene_type:complete